MLAKRSSTTCLSTSHLHATAAFPPWKLVSAHRLFPAPLPCSLLYGEQARFFEDEIKPHLKHKRKGTVGMASAGENLNASQFYITAGDNIDSLDGKHTIFGQVSVSLGYWGLSHCLRSVRLLSLFLLCRGNLL